MNTETQALAGRLIIGQPLDRGVYPDPERSLLQILRQCAIKPEHGYSPKVTKEVWANDRSSLTLENSELCDRDRCTRKLSPTYISVDDIGRISELLGNYTEDEGCKPPKSIQF